MKVLAIRLTSLGDVINTFHAVRGLKEAMPEARISWLTEEAAADLVRSNGDVSETLVLPRRRWQASLVRPFSLAHLPTDVRRFIRGIRQRRFDVLLDFQGHLKSGIIGFLSRTRRRIGFGPGHTREMNHLFTTEQVTPPDGPLPRAEKALALVRALAPAARCARPVLECPPGDRSFAEGLIERLRGDGSCVVAIHPGTSRFGQFKRWPAERYGEVARRLAAEQNARCVLTWGRDEREVSEAAVRASHGAAVAAPAMTITRLAEVLRRVDLLIAADTGPLHLAAALGRPVVAVFGPKDPVVYGPYNCPAAVVRKSLACSPCNRRKCSHVSCLMDIRPDEVYRAALKTLAAPAPGERDAPGASAVVGRGIWPTQ